VSAATREDLDSPSLGAVRPAKALRLEFTKHPGWSAPELERFEEYRRQGDLFIETPPRLLEPPPWIVHLLYRCQHEPCQGHRQRIIDWELTALQARYRRRSEEKLKAAVTRNFFEVPFRGQPRAADLRWQPGRRTAALLVHRPGPLLPAGG
jgi:hypothetical protein